MFGKKARRSELRGVFVSFELFTRDFWDRLALTLTCCRVVADCWFVRGFVDENRVRISRKTNKLKLFAVLATPPNQTQRIAYSHRRGCRARATIRTKRALPLVASASSKCISKARTTVSRAPTRTASVQCAASRCSTRRTTNSRRRECGVRACVFSLSCVVNILSSFVVVARRRRHHQLFSPSSSLGGQRQ